MAYNPKDDEKKPGQVTPVSLANQTDTNFHTGNYGNAQDALNAYRDALSSGNRNLIESVTNNIATNGIDYYKGPEPAAPEPPQAVYGSRTVENYKPTNLAQAADQDAALAKLTGLEEQGRPTYTGSYDQQIQQLLGDIYNRGPFSYNYNEDPLYAQYAESYTQGGRNAMRDTMGQAAVLTGGYGNTYASMAGQQQYNNYMQGLSAKIPELYQIAANRYDIETQNMRDNLSMYNNQDGLDYTKYRYDVGDYESDRDYAYQKWLAAQQQNNYLTELYQQYHKLDPNYKEKTVRTLLGYK